MKVRLVVENIRFERNQNPDLADWSGDQEQLIDILF